MGTSTTVVAYFIWYGDWTSNTATTILPAFVSCLGGSPWLNMVTTYTSSAGVPVTNAVTYGGSTYDSYSQVLINGDSAFEGIYLSDAAIFSVVKNKLSEGSLPLSGNAVYFVLTSQGKWSSFFC
jgi:hypothetical protein